MRKYRPNADSETRVDFAVDVVEALRGFPETASSAAELEQINNELDSSFEARRQHRKPWMRSRAKLRIAEYQLEQAIRSSFKAAQIADGGRSGALTEAIFPDGVGPITSPSGEKQSKVVSDLISRISSSKASSASDYSKEWAPKLTAAREVFTQALASYEEARKNYYDAFTQELMLRDEHERQIERAMGQVRSAFPKDVTRQNLIFPKAPKSAEEEASEVEEGTVEE